VDTYFPAAATSTLDVDVDAINEADDVLIDGIHQ
jgi:hypothetical protein